MPQYWMEDYESGSGDTDVDIEEIVKRCQKIIDKNRFVRIGTVILDYNNGASKYDLLQVLIALESTGKYQSRYIKHKNGNDDFLVMKVPKKSVKERYWFFFEALKYLTGGLIGLTISKLIHI
jgi:hypothetical protein